MVLPGIGFGQSVDALKKDEPYQIVSASRVEVGRGIRLMQVASIAFNPSQRNTHWPLFAYPVKEVFSSRTCESFTNTPFEGEVAFVHPGVAQIG